MNLDNEPDQVENTQLISYPDGVNIASANDSEPEKIDWMWDGWLARGRIHILAGPSTAGKTHIALDFAAILSNGDSSDGSYWPDKSKAPSGKTLIWSDEDSVQETILPRLIAAGANRDKLYFITEYIKLNRSRPFDFKTDIPDLSYSIDKIGGIDLVIIDPIISAITGNANSNSAVRASLNVLNQLCIRHNCAILGIHHLNKNSKGKEPLERVSGSLAFGAFPRVVMMAAKFKGSSPPSSVVVRVKTTNSKQDGGFEYYIEQKTIYSKGKPFKSSFIRWDQPPLTGDPSVILDSAESGKAGKKQSVLEAEKFLKGILANGEVPSIEINEKALEQEISKAALNSAAHNLNVEHVKKTDVAHGHWVCRLPKVQQENESNTKKSDDKTEQSDSVDSMENLDEELDGSLKQEKLDDKTEQSDSVEDASDKVSNMTNNELDQWFLDLRAKPDFDYSIIDAVKAEWWKRFEIEIEKLSNKDYDRLILERDGTELMNFNGLDPLLLAVFNQAIKNKSPSKISEAIFQDLDKPTHNEMLSNTSSAIGESLDFPDR